ncbi:MAG: sulfotransferase domain-containing protein [Sphingomonas sp.]
MLPNFLCIGAQKCATTSLWHLLDAHPDICMARPRETRFFSEPQRFADGLAAYEVRHFGHWDGERAAGEKCPEYLYQPEVPRRLRDALGPDLKFLICLRSPAQRAYSQYRHNLFQLRESRSFEEALAAEAGAGRTVPSPFGYIGRGRYAGQLERYFDLFGAERCHLIAFEAMVEDQAAAADRAFAFLGVGPGPRPGSRVHAGHPPLERMRIRLQGSGETAVVTLAQGAPAGGWRARMRRMLGRPASPAGIVRVRRPSASLQDLARRLETAQPLPTALSGSEERRINRLHFADDLARLAPMLPFGIAAWLEGAGE